MSMTEIGVSPRLGRTGRHFGYTVAIAVNVGMLIVVQYVLDWGWFPFLTDQFAELVSWISFSLMATIVANVVYEFDDAPPVKPTGQILVNLISLFVTYRIFQVFPFDFSGSSFNWDVVVRILLILAMVGSGIGVLTEAVKLGSSEPRHERR